MQLRMHAFVGLSFEANTDLIFLQASKVGKVLIEKGPYIISATMTNGKRAILRVKVEKKHEET